MDVALEPAALPVLRRDEAFLCRLQIGQARAELLRQPLVPQHEPGLGGQVPHELFARLVDRVADRHRHRERAEHLPLVPDLHHEVVAGPGSVGRPGRDRSELLIHDHAHLGTLGAHALAEHTRQSGKHVVGGVGAGELVAERRDDLVRRRAPAVDDAVGEPARPRPHRLEHEGHDARGERRQERDPLEPTSAPTPATTPT